MSTNTSDLLDNPDYPTDWGSFIGQEQAKRQLMVACRSASVRKATLDHILLASGRHGIGKTALALLIAREIGAPVTTISGPLDFQQARILLYGMADGDVLFIDEIHRMVQGGKAKAEWLLHFLQDGVLMTPGGAEEMPNVTVVAASTDAGRLPDTIRSRFPLQPRLTDYTADEAAKIVGVMAERLFEGFIKNPSVEICHQIATSANRNPRQISAVVKFARDLSVATGEDELNSALLIEALDMMGLTPDGLSALACSYLQIMLDEFAGLAGAKAIQDRLQEPGGVASVEQVLMDKGLLTKTRAGRMLTREGIERARDL